jgi:hypothetical protein
MKLYITIQRSDADDLGPFDDDIDAQASCDYFDFLIMHDVKKRFDDPNEVTASVVFGKVNQAEAIGYGISLPAPKIGDWIDDQMNKLYKQPDRWLVKKGASVEQHERN